MNHLRIQFWMLLVCEPFLRASASTARNFFSIKGVSSDLTKGSEYDNESETNFNKYQKRLTEDTMNQNLRTMEYAVRGEVVMKADEINAQLTASPDNHPYPFDHIVYTNIGNPHSVGQKGLTWPRQVMSLVDLPSDVGVNHPLASKMFPSDTIERARSIKKALNGYGIGAYTHSQGPSVFREEICKFIEERDDLEEGSTNPANIFMTNGASSGIEMILDALIASSTTGVMIPIPQYPIYSATIDRFGGKKVGYYLDEENGWDMNLEELERSLADAKANGINVNSFVLINPGNPTGQVLGREAIRDIVKFCSKHNLVLLADEVYQENVYDDDAEFYSCKRAAKDIGLDEKHLDALELISFHSTSKGLFGECGRRGGYMEVSGCDAGMRDQIYKLASANLCSNVPGQIMTSLMVNGPKEGDESYKIHEDEKKAVFESLKRRAEIVGKGFNAIPGFSCQEVQGAMYCFPKVTMPSAAVKYAKEQEMTPDTLYAVSLLESTGICVVPASGFGQEEGRFGFRTTFLPPEDEMIRVVDLIHKHHLEFCKKYQ